MLDNILIDFKISFYSADVFILISFCSQMNSWFHFKLFLNNYITVMKSVPKQEAQPKPRLIVRLGVFLASHHILFRFTILSPSFCSLNPSFCPFSFPQLIIHHFGSVLYAALQALSHYYSFLHLQKTHTSRRMLLYLVFYPSLYFCLLLLYWCIHAVVFEGCACLVAVHPDLFRLHTVDIL